ncbi:MliC family protein [Pelagibacterium luteolum]|uniref:Membrane-bound inhibitor of C-type lysozyme n=1 Tax=Pelagibacterium luteolum TaxID=440168 RepID=A0A1G7SPP0_9HYPH|nr:MliC family protein [Pelagibacterium luteolum]SDG25047.1 Membrane-bound inhibitor of C-type lysozyme [Pelagibacterium luteolum]
MKAGLLAAALTLGALPALAVETSMQLVLELEGNAQRDVTSYTCDGIDDLLTVEYINAHPIFLGIVPVDGESLVFVNVISASGARYVSGQYEWWTQGNNATLTDATADDDADPIECVAAEDIP